MTRGRRTAGAPPRTGLAVAVVLVLASVLASGCADLTRVDYDRPPSATTGPAPSSPGRPSGPPATLPVTPIDGVPEVPDAPATALVDRLRVAEPWSPAPYRRDEFGSGWDYDGRTGCNTRERVLAEESGPGLVVDDRCKPLDGTWRSVYDGLVTSDPADLEIDHLVPLAEAWRTGAAGWTRERRRAFANDLDDPGTLVAVSSRSNRSKQDSTPAGWLPADPDGRCSFVADWVRVKHRWGLTVAPEEKVAITQVLAGC